MIQRLAILAVVLSVALGGAVRAATETCKGQDLIAALPDADRAALRLAADAAPFARGNFWRARKGAAEVTMLGTYHLDDPRHEALMAAVTPVVEGAATVLVEAGPEEERQLMALLARDPSAILAPEGPTLAETLPDAEWQQLAQAMRDRGVPPFMASRFRPWYVTMLLSVPPCALAAAAKGNGLDQRIISLAGAQGVPLKALESFDTALKLFDGMDSQAQLAMVRSTLALEHQAEDQMATLAAAYFAEDSRMIWEYTKFAAKDLPDMTPERIEAEFGAMEEALMNARNRGWIPVIEKAAEGGPVFAGFGALHLSGRNGVLSLLQARGWTVERLPLP